MQYSLQKTSNKIYIFESLSTKYLNTYKFILLIAYFFFIVIKEKRMNEQTNKEIIKVDSTPTIRKHI